MERKLIKQGIGGCTIYLPRKWLDSKGLKSGDKIDVVEKDNYLKIGSEVRGKKETKIIIDKNNKDQIKNLLTHVYRNGFDKIYIENSDSESIREIKETVNLLLGFEITEKKDKSVIIENISEPTEEKYSAILRRIFLIIKETQEVVLKEINNKRINLFEIQELRDQQDRLILFCRRLIMKEKVEGNPLLNWEFLTFLVHIEHSYFYMAKYISDKKVKITNDINVLLRDLIPYFDLLYDAYYQHKSEFIHEINQKRDKYQLGECLKSLERAKGNIAVVASYIREIYRYIQIASSPVLSDIIDPEVNMEERRKIKSY